jgi:Amt family ammonium transporter
MPAPRSKPPEPPKGQAERRQAWRRREDEGSEWFRTLANTTATAIFVYRERFLFANPAALELVGGSENELIGLPFWEVVHPDHRELVRERGEARLRGEAVPSRYQFKILRRDGSERWIDFTAGKILFEGAPAGLGTAFDVTELRAALAAREASEERLRLAQEAAQIVTWEWEVGADRLICSPYAEALFGLGPGELVSSEAFAAVVHPEDLPGFARAVRTAVRTGEPMVHEVRLRTPRGERWVLEQARVVRQADGSVRLLGAAHDITRRKLVELALEASREQFRVLVEHQAELVAKLDEHGCLSYVSPSFCEFFARPAHELLGGPAPFLVEGERNASEVLRRLIVPPHSLRFERRLQGRSGWRWISWSCTALLDEARRVTEILAVGRDSTERKRAEEALYEEKERAQVTLAAIADGVVRTDATGHVDFLNPVAERLTGWSLINAYGRPVQEVVQLLEERTRRPVASPLERCLREQRPIQDTTPLVLVERSGGEAEVRTSVSPLRDRDGELRGAVLVFSDLTPLRTAEREMQHLATHDPLTGLPNRRAFEERLSSELLAARAGRHEVALLYLDLDEFKLVNDTCGHTAGDHLVRQVAEVLRGALRQEDWLARLGGDEFGILLPATNAHQARRHASDLVRTLHQQRFSWEGRSFDVGASIGVVPLGEINGDWTAVLAAADAACYAAKEGGRARVHLYRPDDRVLADRYGDMLWVHRLRDALAEDRLRLFCQPIHPLARHDTPPLGEILVRLADEGGEIVPAAAFIRAAERYHLTPAIDRWVVNAAIHRIARRPPDETTRYAINLSGLSLGEEGFLDHVVSVLEAASADPSRICFEITETAAVANLAPALRLMGVLKQMGCRFVLDDFGSGLSSFGYLKNLPVDYLKIDGAFVRSIAEDKMHRVMVESINHVGHAIGIATIGESVETAAIHANLVAIGVDYGQGYWLSRPAPLA